MKIRQTYLDESGVIDIDHEAIDILADDGRVLFTVDLDESGFIEIHTGSTVKHNDKLLDKTIKVYPRSSNVIRVERNEFE